MPQKKTTLEIIKKINNYWQQENPKPKWTFWDAAVYYTDNMEAYQITKMDAYKKYAESWAEENRWEGAKSKDKNNWKYTYGESDDFVLFGDWQICFQTYIDLYSLDDVKDNNKIFRAKEVMEYQMKTSKNNYWWWADGLFMAMPVMTKLYTITGNQQGCKICLSQA
jgi:rhamnogalacturonyl hydrolase YesR